MQSEITDFRERLAYYLYSECIMYKYNCGHAQTCYIILCHNHIGCSCKLCRKIFKTREMQSINGASLQECWTVRKNSFEDVL